MTSHSHCAGSANDAADLKFPPSAFVVVLSIPLRKAALRPIYIAALPLELSLKPVLLPSTTGSAGWSLTGCTNSSGPPLAQLILRLSGTFCDPCAPVRRAARFHGYRSLFTETRTVPADFRLLRLVLGATFHPQPLLALGTSAMY